MSGVKTILHLWDQSESTTFYSCVEVHGHVNGGPSFCIRLHCEPPLVRYRQQMLLDELADSGFRVQAGDSDTRQMHGRCVIQKVLDYFGGFAGTVGI